MKKVLSPKMQVIINFSGINLESTAKEELDEPLRLKNFGVKECLLPLIISKCSPFRVSVFVVSFW